MGHFLAGTWGQIVTTFVVSLLVVLLEYLIVKPWLEGPGGGGSQTAFVYIERVVQPPPKPSVVAGKDAPTSDRPGDPDVVWLWLFGTFAALFITAAAFLSVYWWVVDVVIGVDVGLAVFTLLTYRRTVALPIPRIRFWLVLSTVTAAVGVWGVLGVALGRYKGHTIGELRGEVSSFSWLDAMSELIHRYDWTVLFFLGYKAIGILVIILICLYNLIILTGITTALSALTTGNLNTVRAWLIRLILPLASGKPLLILVPSIVFWVLGVALTSGAAWNWVNNHPVLPPSVPTTSPTPSPSSFPPPTAPTP